MSIARIDGQLTRGNAAVTELKAAVDQVLAEGQSNLLVDMPDISLIDATGLGALVGALTSMRNAGGDLKLLNVQPKIKSVLDINRLSTVLDIHDDLDRALDSFSQPIVSDPSSSVHQKLALAWKQTKNPPALAIPTLLRLLSDKHFIVQAVAAQALANLAGKMVMPDPALNQLLVDVFDRSPRRVVREQILLALQALGHPTEPLEKRIDIYDPIAFVKSWIDGREVGVDGHVLTGLAENFQREGAPASDRLAELLEQLLDGGDKRICNVLDVLSEAVILTERLTNALRKVLRLEIAKTLEIVDNDRRALERGVSPQYGLRFEIFSPSYTAAFDSIARSSPAKRQDALKMAEDQLKLAGSNERAGAALDKAVQHLTAALQSIGG